MISSKIIRDYFYHRLNSPILPGTSQLFVNCENNGDNQLVLSSLINKSINRVSYTINYFQEERKIEIRIDPLTAGINENDVENFLESLVLDDKIFDKDMPLGSSRINVRIDKCKNLLKRQDLSSEGKMICIVDESAEEIDIPEMAYDYMFRSCLHYLFHLGKFSVKQ